MSFYVYALFSSEKPEVPFYIGKGNGKRLTRHLVYAKKKRNTREKYIVGVISRGGKIEARKISDNLSEALAFKLERDLIRFYGRKPNGPLLNFTDGGEGTSGNILSEVSCSKIKAANTEAYRKLSDEEKMRRAVVNAKNGRSAKCREASSKANTGRKLSAEHRAAISAAHKGKSKPLAQRLKIAESNRLAKRKL